MRLAIMQPYLFPYIGYFQLINSVDKFVVYDDVQYIKNGWINKNNILINNQKKHFTLSVENDSHTKNINERHFSKLISKEKLKLIKSIEYSYRKSPYFHRVFPFLKKIILNLNDSNDIGYLLTNQLIELSMFLKINTKIIRSSQIKELQELDLNGQERIIKMVKLLGGSQYINAFGGRSLYSNSAFKEKKIELNFIETRHIVYAQFGGEFVANLSIIDVMMFNSPKQIREMLNEYDLI
ncbi:MAG: WbqC family protein [Patescibacteria group bacterium]